MNGRTGAGMNGKIGQSMSFGLPVVTTPIGAEGLGAVPDADLLVAGDAASFAAKVVQLYRDEATWRYELNGRSPSSMLYSTILTLEPNPVSTGP